MTEAGSPGCKKQNCQFPATGMCAEGHDPVRLCPNFLEEAGAEVEIESEDHAEGSADLRAIIHLPAGNLLSVASVDRFLLWRPAVFVAVVGDSNSGKTTLVCAVYDRFLRGPFAGVGFSSSRTLVALEQRIYPSRVDSNRDVPDTPRTSIADGIRYYHLAFAPLESPRRRLDLMISDRAGETYRIARSHTEKVADLPEIFRADSVSLLLDGERVADPAERSSATQSTRQMLRALLDNGALDSTSIVQIVTTKYDRIAKAQDTQSATETLAAFRSRLASDFEPRLAKLSFHDVAARDPDSHFAPAHGMDALLVAWMTARSPKVRSAPAPTKLTSEFDRLLSRTPLEGEHG